MGEGDDNGVFSERTRVPVKLVAWLVATILTSGGVLTGAVIAGVMKDSQIGERLQGLESKMQHVSEMVQTRMDAEEARTRAALIELRLAHTEMIHEVNRLLSQAILSQWERFRWFLALTAEMNQLKLPDDPVEGLGSLPERAKKGGT